MFEITRSSISGGCLSEITDVIVATNARFIELVGIGEEAIDLFVTSCELSVVSSAHPTTRCLSSICVKSAAKGCTN
jgi:hypothetical protein